jgi:hypothetical protein
MDSSPSRKASISSIVKTPYNDNPAIRKTFFNIMKGLAMSEAAPTAGRLCAPIFISTWAPAPISVQKNTNAIDSR